MGALNTLLRMLSSDFSQERRATGEFTGIFFTRMLPAIFGTGIFRICEHFSKFCVHFLNFVKKRKKKGKKEKRKEKK